MLTVQQAADWIQDQKTPVLAMADANAVHHREDHVEGKSINYFPEFFGSMEVMGFQDIFRLLHPDTTEWSHEQNTTEGGRSRTRKDYVWATDPVGPDGLQNPEHVLLPLPT